MTVKIGNREIKGLSRNYSGGQELLALIGSSGRLEIALREGSASQYLSAHIGDEVSLQIQGGNRQ